MFFTLSGYLITGVLSDELARTGRIGFGRFYARRALRLVPALVLLVLGVVVVTLLFDPLGDRGELARTVLYALTWTGNLPFGHASDATFHLWTLATEEQFYLVWPALLAFAFARGRVGTSLLVAAAACLAACVASLVWLRAEPDLAYALPTSWAVCFVVGAAVRLYGAQLRAPVWGVPVALVGLTVLSVVPLRGHALTYLAGGPTIAALTGLLLLAWRSWYDVRPPALALLVRLGAISYAAYLWDYPLTLWLQPSLPDHVAGALALALTLLVATASTRWVEEPLLRLREQARPRSTTVAT